MILNITNDIDLSSFYVVFKGSTMNEKPGWYGLSHLMEHLLCKGVEHLMDDFQRYDITHNAYTSENEIVFFIEGLDKYVNKYKDEFLDGLLSYKPTLEELENEKKIVIEEYKDSFNSQLYSHFLNVYRKKYKLYGPIGLRNDIENYTIDDCLEYQSNFLKSPSMIINVSKNNDFTRDMDFVTNINPSNIKEYDNVDTYNIIDDENITVSSNKIPLELSNKFNNKSSILNISPIIKDDFAIIKFINSMLSDGLNSPLYNEIREKNGLAYYVNATTDKLDNKNIVICIYTETSNNNVEKVQYEIKNILDNKEKYLTQERFDIIKDNYLVKIEERKILVHNNVIRYINDDKWNIENIINDITLNDIYNIFDKYYKWDNFYKSVYGEEFD